MGYAQTKLLVSDADKEKAWLDVDDVSLGRFCRWFIIKANQADAERAEASDMPMLSLMAMHAGVALCRFAHEVNADEYTTKLTAVMSASGPLGDWEIVVKRKRAAEDISEHRRNWLRCDDCGEVHDRRQSCERNHE